MTDLRDETESCYDCGGGGLAPGYQDCSVCRGSGVLPRGTFEEMERRCAESRKLEAKAEQAVRDAARIFGSLGSREEKRAARRELRRVYKDGGNLREEAGRALGYSEFRMRVTDKGLLEGALLYVFAALLVGGCVGQCLPRP